MKTRFLFLLFVCASICSEAFADGGHLRFSQPAGRFQVTLFTAPEPLTPGPADFSVMVQDGTSNQVLPDVAIELTLTGPEGRIIAAHARAGLATNRLLQAADVVVPSLGTWHVVVQVKQGGRTGSCEADIVVGAGSRKRYLVWIFSLLPVFATMLFVLNQKQKGNVRTRDISEN
jgi:hypothetical protein